MVAARGRKMIPEPRSEIDRATTPLPARFSRTIARPFAVGKFEVTFAEWAACAGVALGIHEWRQRKLART